MNGLNTRNLSEKDKEKGLIKKKWKMRLVKVAVIQMACSEDHDENVDKAENLVREAAAQKANIILLPELFETRYFCKQQNPEFFEWARPFEKPVSYTHLTLPTKA